MIEKYGGMCACCHESRLVFLTIDHINGGGRAHREKITNKHGSRFYSFLARLPLLPELRVLCMNCNWAIRYGEVCPHQLTADLNSTAR